VPLLGRDRRAALDRLGFRASGNMLASLCWFAAGGWKNTRLTDEDIQVAEKTIAEDNIR
jgi:hypothetical protein